DQTVISSGGKRQYNNPFIKRKTVKKTMNITIKTLENFLFFNRHVLFIFLSFKLLYGYIVVGYVITNRS
ncbi:MAG: hypothetical protein WCN92_09690, partial [Eubacteriales bacterium]